MWVFIAIFLILKLAFSLLFNVNFPSVFDIVTSFIPISGIGYVWIIRVFFTIAIFVPLLYMIVEKVDKIHHKFAVIILLLVVQQVLCYLTGFFTGYSAQVYKQLIPISFGFLIIALIGM